MTQYTHATRDNEGLNWARIAGISSAIAVHVAALLLILVPATAPKVVKEEEQVTVVNLIKPPPPPPPPPPPKEPPKQLILNPPKQQIVQPTPTPPPPEQPPVIVDNPSPVDVPAPPPAPPAPPAKAPAPPPNVVNGQASVCSKTSPSYPPTALREQAEGTTIVQVTWTPDGTITDASVRKSAGNRDLDRAAVTAVRRWKVCPGDPGTAVVPVVWSLE
ncbi:energy transducer TonB [Cognatilysobacter segetis]|uniref:energy transducer TonB n=1 Tax=Cognatilysobacter segetis TaxID=2492394 RepID=UPI00105C2CCF|nr:energy transducer TonB [Lysobacter segetis]